MRKRKNRIISIISGAIAAGAIAAVGVAGADAPGTGIIVCHDPSGQNPQTLTTPNQASYDAHIGHGDTPGPCPVVEPPTTTTEEPPTTTTPPVEPPKEQPPVGPVPKEPATVPEPGSDKKSQQAAVQAQQAVDSGTAVLSEEQGGPDQIGG